MAIESARLGGSGSQGLEIHMDSDVRAVAQSTFRQVCRDRIVGDIPRVRRRRRASHRFPNAGGAGKQVSAARGRARLWLDQLRHDIGVKEEAAHRSTARP